MPPKLTALLLGLTIGVELPICAFLKELHASGASWGFEAVASLLTWFLNPIYILSGLAHIARSYYVTAFEISLLGGWVRVALARVTALLTYMLPYIGIQVTALGLVLGVWSLLPYALASVLVYAGLALTISLAGSKVLTIATSALTLFTAPLSASLIMMNYSMLGASLGPALSTLTYVLNPLATYAEHLIHPKLINASPTEGLVAGITTAIILYIAYIVIFKRLNIKI